MPNTKGKVMKAAWIVFCIIIFVFGSCSIFLSTATHCYPTQQSIKVEFAQSVKRERLIELFTNLTTKENYPTYRGYGFGDEADALNFTNGNISHQWTKNVTRGWFNKVVPIGPDVTWKHKATDLMNFKFYYSLSHCNPATDDEIAEFDKWEQHIRDAFPTANLTVKHRYNFETEKED